MTDTRRPLSVLLCDDLHSYRQALRFRLGCEPDMTVYEATSVDLAPSHASAQDIAVIGFGGANGHGLELVRRLATLRPGIPSLLLTDTDSALEFASAVDAGGAGAISRRAHLEDIITAIRTVGNGRPLELPEAVQEKLSDARRLRIERDREARLVAELTPREVTVTRCLVQGYTIRQTARRLHISESTLRNHVANILAKLQLRSHAQLVSFAIAAGIANAPTTVALLDAAREVDLSAVANASYTG